MCNLSQRFNLSQLNEPNKKVMPLLTASFVDPHFRNLHFLTEDAKASVREAVQGRISEFSEPNLAGEKSGGSTCESNEDLPLKKKSKTGDGF